MKRRDLIADHLLKKETIEDIMKSIAWTSLSGVAFAMAISSLKSAEFIQGALLLCMFLATSTITFIYVAMYVFIPLDSAMYPDDPYWNEKAHGLTGLKRLIEVVKVLVVRRQGLRIILCLGYFLYANEVSNYLADKV